MPVLPPTLYLIGDGSKLGQDALSVLQAINDSNKQDSLHELISKNSDVLTCMEQQQDPELKFRLPLIFILVASPNINLNDQKFNGLRAVLNSYKDHHAYDNLQWTPILYAAYKKNFNSVLTLANMNAELNCNIPFQPITCPLVLYLIRCFFQEQNQKTKKLIEKCIIMCANYISSIFPESDESGKYKPRLTFSKRDADIFIATVFKNDEDPKNFAQQIRNLQARKITLNAWATIIEKCKNNIRFNFVNSPITFTNLEIFADQYDAIQLQQNPNRSIIYEQIKMNSTTQAGKLDSVDILAEQGEGCILFTRLDTFEIHTKTVYREKPQLTQEQEPQQSVASPELVDDIFKKIYGKNTSEAIDLITQNPTSLGLTNGDKHPLIYTLVEQVDIAPYLNQTSQYKPQLTAQLRVTVQNYMNLTIKEGVYSGETPIARAARANMWHNVCSLADLKANIDVNVYEKSLDNKIVQIPLVVYTVKAMFKYSPKITKIDISPIFTVTNYYDSNGIELIQKYPDLLIKNLLELKPDYRIANFVDTIKEIIDPLNKSDYSTTLQLSLQFWQKVLDILNSYDLAPHKPFKSLEVFAKFVMEHPGLLKLDKKTLESNSVNSMSEIDMSALYDQTTYNTVKLKLGYQQSTKTSTATFNLYKKWSQKPLESLVLEKFGDGEWKKSSAKNRFMRWIASTRSTRLAARGKQWAARAWNWFRSRRQQPATPTQAQ